ISTCSEENQCSFVSDTSSQPAVMVAITVLFQDSVQESNGFIIFLAACEGYYMSDLVLQQILHAPPIKTIGANHFAKILECVFLDCRLYFAACTNRGIILRKLHDA